MQYMLDPSERQRVEAQELKNECALDAASPIAAQVVVVGRGYANILNAVRALGEAGYAADVIRVFKKPESMGKRLLGMAPEKESRYVRRYMKCAAAEPESIVEALCELADPCLKKLVIPVDDYSALTLDGARDRLSDRFFIHGTGDGGRTLAFLMRKDVQKTLAQSAGLDVIAGRIIDAFDWTEEDMGLLHFPCFAKPNVSAVSSKAKIARCDTPEELSLLLEKYRNDGEAEVLVEELVDVTEERSVIGVCAGGRVVVPGFVRSLQGGGGQRRGVMLSGEVLPPDSMAEVVKSCGDLVLDTGFEGVFDIDLLVSSEGTVYFAELNFRPGASTCAVVRSGVNVLLLFAEFVLLGKKLPDGSGLTCNRSVFANEKVLLEECVAGGITPARMKRLIRNADIAFISDGRDPGPYECFRSYEDKLWLRWLKRRLARLVR